MIGQNEIPFSVLKGLVHFARRIDAQVFGLESGSLESAKQQQSVGFGILDEQNAQGTAESSNVRFSVHAIGRVQRQPGKETLAGNLCALLRIWDRFARRFMGLCARRFYSWPRISFQRFQASSWAF